MNMNMHRNRPRRDIPLLAILAVTVLLLPACGGGSSGSKGKAGSSGTTPTETELTRSQVAPEIIVSVLDVKGASGPGGSFLPSDRAKVRFTLTKAEGSSWNLDEMVVAQALLSGPTFRYQRVIPLQHDVTERAKRNKNGVYSYTLPKIPKTYSAPYNDSPSFGPDFGELTGTKLLDGTYTLGLFFAWDYQVDGRMYRQSGGATVDVLIGQDPGSLAPRLISSTSNCNQCHVRLEAHGGTYRGFTSCLLCHTAGSEDLNDMRYEAGSPGVSIDSTVLFHRLHNGAHLPSVLGLGVNPDGTQDYSVEPVPYRLVGAGGIVLDATRAGFPVWPGRTIGLPVQLGFETLSPEAQAKEMGSLTGVTSCYVCHGDPDGDGPREAPKDGGVILTQQSRRTCWACHDDIQESLPYDQNLGVMPPQSDDATCAICHNVDFGGTISVAGGHLHPLRDPMFDPGLEFELLSVREAGDHDMDGTFDPGEKVELTLRISKKRGLPQKPEKLETIEVVFAGPSANSNLLHYTKIPPVLLTEVDDLPSGGAPLSLGPEAMSRSRVFQLRLPQRRVLELLGRATVTTGDQFQVGFTPIRSSGSTPLVVHVRELFGGPSSQLSLDAVLGQNYIDVEDSSAFQPGDVVVIADGSRDSEEYLSVQFVEGSRLWFASPAQSERSQGLAFPHASAETVQSVVLSQKFEGLHYTVDEELGEIVELIEFGAGKAVLASYTTDFIVPETFPGALHDSPDIDETSGKWAGKALVDGTYRLGIWGHESLELTSFFQSASYNITSNAAIKEVLVGSATQLEPYDLIDSPSNCNQCHQDITFHEGTARGFDSCVLCHGTAGAEDLPRYVSPDAPSTDGVSISFRSLLHRIHEGDGLNDPDFTVVGAGTGDSSFSLNTYADVSFPAQPGGTRHCSACHGVDNEAWKLPSPRNHPTDQMKPTRAWFVVCSACHDSPSEESHMNLNTDATGAESCAICHQPGEELSVEFVHRPR